VASGGTLAGRSGQTLNMGDLNLSDGAIVEAVLGAPGTAAAIPAAATPGRPAPR
jgi:hypothetical protein